MAREQLDGSQVLERLARVGRLDEFWEAIDADDFGAVSSLLTEAAFEPRTIEWVLAKMRDADGH